MISIVLTIFCICYATDKSIVQLLEIDHCPTVLVHISLSWTQNIPLFLPGQSVSDLYQSNCVCFIALQSSWKHSYSQFCAEIAAKNTFTSAQAMISNTLLKGLTEFRWLESLFQSDLMTCVMIRISGIVECIAV